MCFELANVHASSSVLTFFLSSFCFVVFKSITTTMVLVRCTLNCTGNCCIHTDNPPIRRHPTVPYVVANVLQNNKTDITVLD